MPRPGVAGRCHHGVMDDNEDLPRAVTPDVGPAVWPVPRAVVIPRDGDEMTMLAAYLDHYRETFELKCAGVPPARLSERSSPHRA